MLLSPPKVTHTVQKIEYVDVDEYIIDTKVLEAAIKEYLKIGKPTGIRPPEQVPPVQPHPPEAPVEEKRRNWWWLLLLLLLLLEKKEKKGKKR